MLELKNITKTYVSGSTSVEALRGISLQFRKSEFVSILGPSGCGKTTLLNIIGGLDQYTTGDLVINETSTKHFNDRDWDAYRNHSVGFVFQSYNLIPHQSVLENVELALTLSGVGRQERKRRAKEALEQVGLADQLYKRPNQLSGGQMQRVAIARAIVNDPDIILADEPTGALDTKTSVQVMEILKKISQDRLVVMVTHNPELAEAYSSRIVRMLDGLITSDSAPYTEEAEEKSAPVEKKKKKERKPSMSLWTSFGLSLRNLISKKGRTTLTSFAGSIGIIGIALIYAVSQGMTTYINTVQEETLSSYPITIQAESLDMGSLLKVFMGQATSGDHDKDAVYQKTMFYDMVNSLNNMETTKNDLRSFKAYLETKLKDKESAFSQAVAGVQYTYDLDMLVYTKNVDGTILRADSQALLQDLLLEYFGMDLSSMMNLGENYGFDMDAMASMNPMGMSMVLFQEMLPGEDGRLVSNMLDKQYDVIYGSWPTEFDEIVLVVDENNEIDDMTLYALGLKSKEEVDAVANAAINKVPVEIPERKWSFEEICSMDFRVVFGADCYTKDETTGIYTDLRETQTGLKFLYDNGLNLKVSGIIRPKEDALATMLKGTLGYTSKLTEYVIQNCKNAPAILDQQANKDTDIFTGLPFRENTGNLTSEEKMEAFKAYVEKLSDEEKAKTYIAIKSIPSQQMLDSMVQMAMKDMTREKMEDILLQAFMTQTGMPEKELRDYLSKMPEEDITETFTEMVIMQAKAQYAAQVQAQMANMPAQQLVMALTAEMAAYTPEQFAQYYDEVLEFSDSDYETNLIKLGCLELDSPASINLYAVSFESKDIIEDAIADYNKSVDDLKQLRYTDYVGLMMSSITTIINAITYVLIAFVAVSLVVSSIMIGVITLISVQERTKEIGVLRAVGASKRNVSNMFNAETVIIGFTSGLIGVGFTWFACIPINMILHAITGINNLSAYLPWQVAVVLVAISVILTLFAGIIPSRSAAKKDPVVALRTE